MQNVSNEIFFDINHIKIPFNSKIKPTNFFIELEKEYDIDESTKFAFFCYNASKKNPILISLTSKKLFIFSGKSSSLNVSYLFSEIKDAEYKASKFKQPTLTIKLSDGSEFVYKGTTEKEAEIFIRTLLKIKSSLKSSNLSRQIDEESTSTEHEEPNVLNQEENFEIQNLELPKKKRVINDKLIANDTALSSFFIHGLFTNPDSQLPNGEQTILKNIADRLKYLERTNLFQFDIDSIPLKVSSESKFNTVPVIAQFSSLNRPDEYESKFLFAHNWIEYTKHNVKNKLLGVDINGNGAYIEMKNYISTSSIEVYKAKEYKINDEIRHGLRSSQTISKFERNQKLGIDSLYFNLKTNQKLNVNQYDGIIFQGLKYYFNVMNEFNSLQRKYCKIFHREMKTNGEVLKSYEIIFEDDLISYKAYNARGILIDDLTNNSSSFDLKWLTFFRD